MDDKGHAVALKILKSRQVGKRSWQRFRREVEFVDGLDGRPGVLPIEAFFLPDELAKGQRA
jgi:hypothetical protein